MNFYLIKALESLKFISYFPNSRLQNFIIMKLCRITLLTFFIFFLLHYSSACNGYKATLISYKNCVDNGVIQLPEKDFNVVLDKDCNIYFNGCIEITKPFKTAVGKYVAKKPPLPEIDGKVDFCKMSDKLKKLPDVIKAMELLGIPSHCPVEAGKICTDPEKKISIAKYKNQIGMATGNSEARIEVEHDVGKTCYEIKLNLKREGRRG